MKYPGHVRRYEADAFSPGGSVLPSMVKPRPAFAPLRGKWLMAPVEMTPGSEPTRSVTSLQKFWRTGGPLEVRLRKRHADDEHVRRIEAGIDVHQARETLDHQAGGNEDDERERDFGGDQRAAQDGESAG